MKYNHNSNTLAIHIDNLITKSGKNIKLIWTPGHCGITVNEKADKLARQTVNNPTTEIVFYSSLIDIHKNLNNHCLNLWELER
jgi:ribonuclease HI